MVTWQMDASSGLHSTVTWVSFSPLWGHVGVSGRAGLGLDYESPKPTLPQQHHVSRGPIEAAAHPAPRRQAGCQVETSIYAQVTNVTSGQLMYASLDTEIWRVSFCWALCPETPNSPMTPSLLTSHSNIPNSWQVAEDLDQGKTSGLRMACLSHR